MGLGSEALGWKNGLRAFHKAKTRSQDTPVNTVGCIFLSKNQINQKLCLLNTMPQPLVCLPSFLPGNLFIILFQLTKSEATCCNSFGYVFVGSFRCPNLQRALTKKAKGDNKKIIKFSPGNLIITLYQLSKFEAPSCNGNGF